MRDDRLALALTLSVALLALGGCVVDEEPEGNAVREPAPAEEPAASVSIEASAPFGADDELTPERLEAERLDRSWQRYAQENLQARQARQVEPGERGESEAAGQDASAAEDRARARAEATGNPALARMRRPGATAAAGEGAERSGQAPAERQPGADGPGSSGESWEAISPESLTSGEARLPVATEGGGPTVLRVQWLLDRVGFSPGVIDGRWGKNTEKAVYWLQHSLGIEPTGRIDRDLYDRLDSAVGEGAPVREYTVTAQDLAGPFTDVPDDPEAQADLECLCYASPQELLAERFHTTGELLAQLNPEVDLANLDEETRLWVPAVDVREAGSPGERGDRSRDSEVARVVISRGGFYIHALDDAGDVLYHFPSTMGSQYNPSPEGSLEVEGVAWRPDFHYQPKLLASPDEVQQVEDDLMLPPGPNSPVGVVWMQLSKPHYGIHGTARPETIGYATSHGCIRMTNWDAIFLGQRVSPGTPVEFRP